MYGRILIEMRPFTEHRKPSLGQLPHRQVNEYLALEREKTEKTERLRDVIPNDQDIAMGYEKVEEIQISNPRHKRTLSEMISSLI